MKKKNSNEMNKKKRMKKENSNKMNKKKRNGIKKELELMTNNYISATVS